MIFISNPPKGGRISSNSAREEYLFYWQLHRLYNNRYRDPFIMSACNIIYNALSSASNGHNHNGRSMHSCASYSYAARHPYATTSFYESLNMGVRLSKDRKVAAALKEHRATFVKKSRD